ncbi:threonine aldolase family protein [Marinicella sediminis]|uniref:Threonine aldolase family protein n=2 Tax=Marinicella sediminis TaxID=1792834 RepID=A0ABV7J7U8_9GAMM
MHQHDHQHWLKIMQQSTWLESGIDCYNKGELVNSIESKVCQLLDKPASLIFTKGTTCQLAALKTASGARDNPYIALHRRSHIAEDEEDAYIHVTGLKPLFIGQTTHPFGSHDLRSLDIKPAVLTVELPLRRVGFRLTPWDELLAMRKWCDEHQVHFHLDGARLWESTHFYQKPLPEIAALFDSVYVSLYKGIGGLSGAVLLGENNFIEWVKPWRNRLGSQPWTQFPALITALEGLQHNLPQIPGWTIRAKALAQSLKQLDDITVDTPHTNAFQVRLKGDATVVNQKLLYLQDQLQLVVCKPFAPAQDSDWLFTEVQIGKQGAHITNQEVVDFFTQLTT